MSHHSPSPRTPTGPRASRTPTIAFACALALAGPAAAQSQWTDLGCSLDGAGGPPVLTGTGTLEPLSSNSVQLDQAAPNSLAYLFLSLFETPTRFKGGVLKPLPNVEMPLFISSSTGEIDLPFTWPAGVPESLPFYLQYAVQDAGAVHGVALSNELRGVTPGPAVVDELSTTTLGPGDLLSITGVNLGDSENDICLLLHADGQTMGFTRAQSVSGNTVTTAVGALRPGATTANLVLNVGEGAIVPPTGLPAGLTMLNGGSWVFSGDPANMVMVEQEIDLFDFSGQDTEGTPAFYQFLYSELVSGGWLEIEMPQGDCLPGTTMTFQLDACTETGVLSLDYYVSLQNTTTLDALTCATVICQQFQAAVLAQLGVLITCIPVQSGSDVFLRVLPPAGETWKSWSGAYFNVCFPAVSCDAYLGDLQANGVIELTMPASVPDGAGVTYYAEGATDQNNYGWAYGSLIMRAGPATPLDIATAVADAMQQAFDDQGIPASALATTVGTDVVIQLFAPFLETWQWGYSYLEICDLQ